MVKVDQQFVRLFLHRELESRKRKNPRYSLRAFARALEIDPSLLTKYLSGSRGISKLHAQKIQNVLGLSDGVFDTVVSKNPQQQTVKTPTYVPFEDMEFAFSCWQAQAILARAGSGNFAGDHTDLAREFGVDEPYAKDIFEKLLATGLIRRKNPGDPYESDIQFVMGKPRDIKHGKAKQQALQRSYLEKTTEFLDGVAEHSDFVSSHVFLMDPKDAVLAMNMSRSFRSRVCEKMDLLAQGKDEVKAYAMQISLVPLSKDVAQQ